MEKDLAKTLIAVGIVIVVVGLIFLYRDRLPFLGRLGRLPGDIAYEKENFRFYFPITTSLLISFILSLIYWIFFRPPQ